MHVEKLSVEGFFFFATLSAKNFAELSNELAFNTVGWNNRNLTLGIELEVY